MSEIRLNQTGDCKNIKIQLLVQLNRKKGLTLLIFGKLFHLIKRDMLSPHDSFFFHTWYMTVLYNMFNVCKQVTLLH